jgi:hypothetical protein
MVTTASMRCSIEVRAVIEVVPPSTVVDGVVSVGEAPSEAAVAIVATSVVEAVVDVVYPEEVEATKLSLR